MGDRRRRRRRSTDGDRNQCLTMHQPWASLLVHGIKRVEGRNWPSPLTGRLWIHAAGKVPDAETIKAMEDFYREIYALNGMTDLQFPEQYPVSRLLGCVEVVGSVKCEELAHWEAVPEGVRLEALAKFCWLCEQPQKLSVPLEMRGYQGVYNLERKIYEAAVEGLCPVEGPLLVKFPLPDPQDHLSLKPGSLGSNVIGSKAFEVEKSPSLMAAIAGACAAATQFSKKEQSHQTNMVQERVTTSGSTIRRKPGNNYIEVDRGVQERATFESSMRRQPRNNYVEGVRKVQERAMSDSSIRRQSSISYTEDRRVQARATIVSTGRQQPRNNYNDEHINFQERVTTDSMTRRQLRNSYTEDDRSVQERVAFDSTVRRQPRNNFPEDRQFQERVNSDSSIRRQPRNNYTEVDRISAGSLHWKPRNRDPVHIQNEQMQGMNHGGNGSNLNQAPHRDMNPQAGASSKIFAAAMKGLRQHEDISRHS